MDYLEETVFNAVKRMVEKLVDIGYVLYTTEEAIAFLTHFLIKEVNEDNMNMIQLNRISQGAINERKKKYPDIALLTPTDILLIKVRLIPKGLKARHARERIWGRKREHSGERAYGILDYAKRFNVLAKDLRKKRVSSLFIIFDEKNYLDEEKVRELKNMVNRINPACKILYLNMRRCRESKTRNHSIWKNNIVRF
ncbi:MAG: hypothetical protein DRJ47_04415 [Thermoprotei archaeon]|nr:MAG: hypothetical protein DRJ47_04415 [Thermoprotei archaeon]